MKTDFEYLVEAINTQLDVYGNELLTMSRLRSLIKDAQELKQIDENIFAHKSDSELFNDDPTKDFDPTGQS